MQVIICPVPVVIQVSPDHLHVQLNALKAVAQRRD